MRSCMIRQGTLDIKSSQGCNRVYKGLFGCFDRKGGR
jgi:hypothetical protein